MSLDFGSVSYENGQLVFCRLAAHIRCPDLLLVDDTKGGVGNVVGDGVKAGGYKLNIARYSGN